MAAQLSLSRASSLVRQGSTHRSPRRRPNELQCRVGIIPAENARLFAFKHRRRHEELLDLLTDARSQGHLSSRGDWHGQDSIVANATGAVRPVLFHSQVALDCGYFDQAHFITISDRSRA
jgi:hypothetical protein